MENNICIIGLGLRSNLGWISGLGWNEWKVNKSKWLAISCNMSFAKRLPWSLAFEGWPQVCLCSRAGNCATSKRWSHLQFYSLHLDRSVMGKNRNHVIIFSLNSFFLSSIHLTKSFKLVTWPISGIDRILWEWISAIDCSKERSFNYYETKSLMNKQTEFRPQRLSLSLELEERRMRNIRSGSRRFERRSPPLSHWWGEWSTGRCFPRQCTDRRRSSWRRPAPLPPSCATKWAAKRKTLQREKSK